MIEYSVQFDRSSARVIDALGMERTATPAMVSRAFSLFAKNVRDKVKTVMSERGSPETGQLQPLSEMSKMLRPNQELGGNLASNVNSLVHAQPRGQGSYWAGYISTVQRAFEVWQTAGSKETTAAQRRGIHIKLARAAKRHGRKSTRDEHRKVSSLHVMHSPDRQVIGPLADYYATEFPRQMRSVLLKQIEGVIKERKT